MAIPAKISPMMAKINKMGDAVFDLQDYVMQEKIDGTRIIVVKEPKSKEIHLMGGRSWKIDYTDRYPEIIDALRRIKSPHYIIDAELAFFNPQTDACQFLTVAAKRETIEQEHLTPKLVAFDILEYDGYDLRDDSLLDRLDILNKAMPKKSNFIQTLDVYTNPAQFEEIYNDIVVCGGEGVVLKNADSTYQEGSRNSDWIKVKRFDTDDFFICGVTEGTGQRESTFGALILGQYDNKGNVHTVNCGTGMNYEQIEAFAKILRRTPAVKPYFNTKGLKVQKAIAPQFVAECKYMEKTKDGSFRLPVFLRFRTDKTPQQCVVT